MIINLVVRLIKKKFLNEYIKNDSRGHINVKVDLSNYAKKSDLKNSTGTDTSKLAQKTNLATLEAEIDKIDVDKLKTVPVDLSKLKNVVNNDVVKKTVYDKLLAEVNNIDPSGFVLKAKYNTGKSDLEKKISHADSDTSGLVKKQIIVLKLVK